MVNHPTLGVPFVTEYTAFKVELTDSIAHVQINRPEKVNAMNAAFWEEIVDIFQWIDDTDAVRAVVISGAGKHFSAGIDLMMLASLAGEMGKDVGRNARFLRKTIQRLQASFTAVDSCRKPVLAAVQGYCIGGAIDLISACDMRYCSSDAQFSIKEIDMGMAADVGTLQRLPRIIGDGMMRELAFTGRNVAADEALRIGLVNRVYDDHAALLDGVLPSPARLLQNRRSRWRAPGNAQLHARPPHRRWPGLHRHVERRDAAVRDLRVAVAAHMSNRNRRSPTDRAGARAVKETRDVSTLDYRSTRPSDHRRAGRGAQPGRVSARRQRRVVRS